MDPDTAFLSGLWASDDGGTDILINGISTGQTNVGLGTLVPFLINGGFLPGINTLDFVVNNGSSGPTGLRVEGLDGFAVAPEPSSLAMLLGLGGIGLLGYLRRRRRSR